MSIRARVVVMGTTAEDPPPGLGAIERTVDVAFAGAAEELAAALPGSDVLLAWRPEGGPLQAAWEHAGDLRWIQSASAGVERLLFPELVQSYVVLTNARGVFDEAIAEYVVCLLLLFSKGLVGVLERQRRREWVHRETEMLSGRHVLVVGTGPIGRAIGRNCAALGAEVRGVARTPRSRDVVFGRIAGIDRLLGALPWADYVVDALPATQETHHTFGEQVFGAMNPWTRFVNIGRGTTVDEAALVRALETGQIAGAALDVFEEEPLPEASPLWGMPNAIVSPHMSGDLAGWREAVVELFIQNLERYITGKPLLNVVDKALGYVRS